MFPGRIGHLSSVNDCLLVMLDLIKLMKGDNDMKFNTPVAGLPHWCTSATHTIQYFSRAYCVRPYVNI